MARSTLINSCAIRFENLPIPLFSKEGLRSENEKFPFEKRRTKGDLTGHRQADDATHSGLSNIFRAPGLPACSTAAIPSFRE